jgi:hypothetical protein
MTLEKRMNIDKIATKMHSWTWTINQHKCLSIQDWWSETTLICIAWQRQINQSRQMDLVHQICNQPTKSDCSFRSMPIKKKLLSRLSCSRPTTIWNSLCHFHYKSHLLCHSYTKVSIWLVKSAIVIVLRCRPKQDQRLPDWKPFSLHTL